MRDRLPSVESVIAHVNELTDIGRDTSAAEVIRAYAALVWTRAAEAQRKADAAAVADLEHEHSVADEQVVRATPNVAWEEA